MQTLPATRKPLQAVSVTGSWLLRPICPCEILPQGFPGVLLVNSRPYLCSVLGELPDAGEPRVDGYRLTKEDGSQYDIDLHASWGGWDCSCPDSTFRGHRPGGCKHISALRQALGATAPPAGPAARQSAA